MSTASGFTTKGPQPIMSAAVVMTAADLMSRCAAAARMSMRGDGYSTEDRAECAAKLAAMVMATRSRWTGRPADVLRYLDWAETYPATVRAMAAEEVATVPAAAATFTRLAGMAANVRRSLDRDRARDAAEAARRAASDSFTPLAVAEDSAVRSTPHGARRTAVDMLRNLGLLGEGSDPDRVTWDLPTLHAHGRPADVLRYLDRAESILRGRAWPIAWGDFLRETPRLKSGRRAESPDGPLWSAAYAAARAAAGVDAAAIAAELELEPATLRQHLSRAAKRIPSVTAGYSIAAHSSALGIPEPVARKASATRTHSADLDHRDRTRPDVPAPVTVRTDRTLRHDRRVKVDRRPQWARDLPTGSAARLHYAAEVKRARRDEKSDAQRATDRAAAGLQGAVL